MTVTETASANPAPSHPATKAAERIYDVVNKVFVALTHLSLFAMVILISLDALGRYLFNSPLGGMDELSDEFFMPALIYLVAAHVYDTGGHISITTVSDYFPEKLRKFSVWVGDVLGAAFFGLITYAITVRMIDAYRFKEYSSSPLNYLLAHSYAIVAAGCALLTARMFVAVITARHPVTANPHDFKA